jgi:transcriptional regulator with XRE-family HTH domain
MGAARSATGFDLCGVLRRIRRRADLSQRQLAVELHVSKSTVAAAEAGSVGMDARLLAVAAGLAGLRLALVDEEGTEVRGMDSAAVRDQRGRRFPAHLDPMLSEERWWRWADRPDRRQPTYTFDRRRAGDDARRRAIGRPEDHRLPQPGDSPAERAAARRRVRLRAAAEERERRFLAGAFRGLDDGFVCQCPAACDELDDRSGKPVHAPGCSCDCDLA